MIGSARADFRIVEGWLQLIPGAGLDNYGDAVAEGKAILCGTSADVERFVV